MIVLTPYANYYCTEVWSPWSPRFWTISIQRSDILHHSSEPHTSGSASGEIRVSHECLCQPRDESTVCYRGTDYHRRLQFREYVHVYIVVNRYSISMIFNSEWMFYA